MGLLSLLVGAFVVDEDLSILGENGEKYKKTHRYKVWKNSEKNLKFKVKKEAKNKRKKRRE